MTNGFELLVVGSYNQDTTLIVDEFPRPGETILARGGSRSHGGKGSNQAVQAARLGAAVKIVAAVGDDAAGRAAIELWHDEGVGAEAVAILDGERTGSAAILVDAGGQNMIVVDAAANSRVSPEVIAQATARLDPVARLVVGQLEIPQDATLAAFAWARANNIRTMLNAAPVHGPVSPELLDLVDILAVNEIEACSIADLPENGQDAEVAAASLLARVGIAVLLTKGADGAVLFMRDGTVIRQAAAAAEVKDTTGAGDALIGAFAARLTADGDFAAALRWGVAAGTFACRQSGAVPSFATREALMLQLERSQGCKSANEVG